MKAVGARLPRYDGTGQVTGRTTYVDDVRVAGQLWVKALRSPHHYAAIRSLDTSRAEAHPGVHAVITHRDVPKNVHGHLEGLGVPGDEPLLAEDEVRYKGQPIVAVAAVDEATALEALELVDVEYEEREPIWDMRTAFDPESARPHPWGPVYPHYGPHNHRRVRKGDVDGAFDRADTIVQGVYRPQAIEHCPIEPQVALVVPEADGRLTVYSCTQAMYFSMGVVAAHLQWPLNRLKFVGGTVGGGFGGKVDTATETICALLALKARRPVKWRWTREEEFLASSTRAPWHMEVADAVTSDGWILGRRMTTLHDAGAYTRFSSYGLTKHAFHHTGAYTIPNLHFNGYVVYTNRVPTTAMRGFGVTSVSFAVEMHMNRIAEVLGLDPWQLRLRNANRKGDITGNRVVLQDPSTVPVVLAAADRIGYELPAEYRAMTNEPRTGALLPEHLVGETAPTNGGGH
jgi:CO/xanthine dehydrogenase Mo-binding subunit